MGLYNSLFGYRENSDKLLAILGLNPDTSKFEWFDDEFLFNHHYEANAATMGFIQKCIEYKVWLTGRYRDIYIEDGKIVLYTRNGGGNRENYWYVFEILRRHPNYLRDYDDNFDSTYAYIEFSIPESGKDIPEEKGGQKLWNELFAKLGGWI